MPTKSEIEQQIILIQMAMKNAGVWTQEIPEWVRSYSHGSIPDIWQWLQYIHLPMRLNGTQYPNHYLAPIIRPYMNASSDLKELLQLIIELDSIAPTLKKNNEHG